MKNVCKFNCSFMLKVCVVKWILPGVCSLFFAVPVQAQEKPQRESAAGFQKDSEKEFTTGFQKDSISVYDWENKIQSFVNIDDIQECRLKDLMAWEWNNHHLRDTVDLRWECHYNKDGVFIDYHTLADTTLISEYRYYLSNTPDTIFDPRKIGNKSGRFLIKTLEKNPFRPEWKPEKENRKATAYLILKCTKSELHWVIYPFPIPKDAVYIGRRDILRRFQASEK